MMSHYPQSGLSGPGMVEGFYLEQYNCNIMTRSDTSRPVQLQKMAISLKFWI